MNFAPKPGSARRGSRRFAVHSGFTLVEVMVATVLLSMIILGILAVLIGSYRIAARARYNDHARYVIKSFADQFLTQDTTDTNGLTIPFFVPTAATGYSLSWTNSDGSVTVGGSGSPSIPILLGDNTGAPITANLSRQVSYYYTSGAGIGTSTLLAQNASAGYILQGTFKITYAFPPGPQAQTLTQTLVVSRSVP